VRVATAVRAPKSVMPPAGEAVVELTTLMSGGGQGAGKKLTFRGVHTPWLGSFGNRPHRCPRSHRGHC